MSFKILIVEDEELYADQLEMLIEKLGYSSMGVVDNGNEAIVQVQNKPPDLILMDVNIQGKLDGIETAEEIHKLKDIPLIFITSLEDDETFARASAEKPLAFLLKPFTQVQLQRSIELCVLKLSQEKEANKDNVEEWVNDFLFGQHFFIKTRQKLEKVSVNQVNIIEADKNHCYVHTNDRKFVIRMATAQLLKTMPSANFVQTHRSFHVNVNKIDSVDLDENVVFIGKIQVPLSRSCREELMSRLKTV